MDPHPQPLSQPFDLAQGERGARNVTNHLGLLYEGTVEDITQRKQAEEQLEKSLSLLQATLESTADGILAIDQDGQITSYSNPK